MKKYLYLLILFLSSCSKNDNVIIPIIDRPIIKSSPSGYIETLEASDSTVPFNGQTYIKWLVNGTNDSTKVYYKIGNDSALVSSYGVFQTDHLRTTTTFIISINNGVSKSVTVKIVGDSITTLLYNNGKRLRLVKMEVYNQSQYVDSTSSVDPHEIDERYYFSIDGKCTIVQNHPNQYVSKGDVGIIIVSADQKSFIWQGINYNIIQISKTNLIITYSNRRKTYQFE